MASASVDPRDRRQALQTEAGRNCAETVATPSLDTTDPALAAMTREAHRLTLSRLVDEVLDAVEDGDSGVPESGRLHTWVRVEFLPWAQAENMSISDEAERAAVRSDIGVIVGLNSLSPAPTTRTRRLGPASYSAPRSSCWRASTIWRRASRRPAVLPPSPRCGPPRSRAGRSRVREQSD